MGAAQHVPIHSTGGSICCLWLVGGDGTGVDECHDDLPLCRAHRLLLSPVTFSVTLFWYLYPHQAKIPTSIQGGDSNAMDRQ